jgi:site-specific DNA-methyltransferase (adenine-specific)
VRQKPDPKPTPHGTAPGIEPIWILSPDGYRLTTGDDVYRKSSPRLGRDAEANGHKYQKPLAVMRWILSRCPGPTILDPFMGSGTTLRAAKDLGRRAIGVEVEEKYCEIAVRRLAQGVLPFGD